MLPASPGIRIKPISADGCDGMKRLFAEKVHGFSLACFSSNSRRLLVRELQSQKLVYDSYESFGWGCLTVSVTECVSPGMRQIKLLVGSNCAYPQENVGSKKVEQMGKEN